MDKRKVIENVVSIETLIAYEYISLVQLKSGFLLLLKVSPSIWSIIMIF